VDLELLFALFGIGCAFTLVVIAAAAVIVILTGRLK